jgi:hypothetical protein
MEMLSPIDRMCAIERARVQALVAANMDIVRQLHADDFQLINPAGGSLSKAQYLGAVASGELDYRVWVRNPSRYGCTVKRHSCVTNRSSKLSSGDN